ncbi:type II restriction endonuclease [Vibrio vulnificus]|uniref:type II restriction endonuclease n=1 Tax=Vibrio vulnificus TaxID=672 RepID=UPI001CDBEC83|nr:type II restriction endonuclease [Vibrio vulnificus]ELV8688470.1 hypothetical protein [Vibrio vulnificus]ELV8701882.1 hypothetical protein [Vibrio vulnificus]MCA3882971.1 hypothetical protein [Vibrio vulnificus]MCA3949298.1 hypothetical protein [Vibrio vulnificus]MCG6278189.1 hypothetical protein [Vibrio vulnificus]
MFEQLNDVFSAAAFKYLSSVDADPGSSNQHEIGGLVAAGIGCQLGMVNDGRPVHIPCTMVYLDDDEATTICEDHVTWYDARYTNPTRKPEWRLYYKSNSVSERFRPGDFFLIARTHEGTLLLVFCPANTELEAQIRTLFGVRNTTANLRGLTSVDFNSSIAVPIRLMFARYGIEIGSDGSNYLDTILERFGAEFPKTREFSTFSREIAPAICPIETPDKALIAWMETEESAFRQLEKHIVREKLVKGFGENGDDVDDFISFSLSVQNRRKSRSGHAFENHIETILVANNVQFERGARTEGQKKPDFIFPNAASYRDLSFPERNLLLLGAKTTCKDRWRQVLAEAERVPRKHLITMEPAISTTQTDEMRSQQLQLVVPEPLQSTYQPEQTRWLMTFEGFIDLAKETQRA